MLTDIFEGLEVISDIYRRRYAMEMSLSHTPCYIVDMARTQCQIGCCIKYQKDDQPYATGSSEWMPS